MLDENDMETLLRRLLKPGRMKRVPKNRNEAQAFLALAASVLDPRMDYTEQELNEQLADWLAGFARTSSLDHVTIRRWLVDLNLLLRDAPGSSYRTNQAVINTIITPEARMVQPAVILQEVSADRMARRRAHESS